MSRALLAMELAELDRLVRQLKPKSVMRLEPGSQAYKQLEIVRAVHKQYQAAIPEHVSKLWRNRVRTEQKLFDTAGKGSK